MILFSKVFFGSVALATVAGSVVSTDGAEATRGVMAQRPAAQQAGASADAGAPLPAVPQHCPGHCDVGLLFSQLR